MEKLLKKLCVYDNFKYQKLAGEVVRPKLFAAIVGLVLKHFSDSIQVLEAVDFYQNFRHVMQRQLISIKRFYTLRRDS